MQKICTLRTDDGIIKILLKDRTTGENIIWATEHYHPKDSIDLRNEKIVSKYLRLIKPRVEKSKTERERRSRDNAEVFTPSWVVNKQNNLVDNAWFERENIFNKENDGHSWVTSEKIIFDQTHTWQAYVNHVRLEMCCGEATYLVNRYDSVNGKIVPLENRIGILDRKFRVIRENAQNDEEWLEYAIKAIKAIYGYEFQGDNLFIARENILNTYIDYYKERFASDPSQELLLEVATIISWNIWQMDGLKLVIPYSCHSEKSETVQLSFLTDIFEETEEECRGCVNDNQKQHNGIRCVIMDWEKNKKIKYVELIWGKNFEK